MEFFPFVYEKPKKENGPIPLYKELEEPHLAPFPKKEESPEKEIRIIEIQL